LLSPPKQLFLLEKLQAPLALLQERELKQDDDEEEEEQEDEDENEQLGDEKQDDEDDEEHDLLSKHLSLFRF